MLEISLYYFDLPLNPLPINRDKLRGLLPSENVDFFYTYRTSVAPFRGLGAVKTAF